MNISNCIFCQQPAALKGVAILPGIGADMCHPCYSFTERWRTINAQCESTATLRLFLNAIAAEIDIGKGKTDAKLRKSQLRKIIELRRLNLPAGWKTMLDQMAVKDQLSEWEILQLDSLWLREIKKDD